MRDADKSRAAVEAESASSASPRTPLSDICRLEYGESLKSETRTDGKIPVFGSNGPVGWHDKAVTRGPAIVIGRKGSSGAVNWSSEPCFPIDTTYYVDRTSKPCELKWLYYALVALDLPRLEKSSAVPGLNREDVYKQSILFPSLPLQRRIAAILDKADRLRRMRRYALELSDQFLPALFLRMFGDPVANERSLPMVRLDDYVLHVSSGSTPLGGEAVYPSSGVMFIRSQNVLMNAMDFADIAFISPVTHSQMNRTQVRRGDVLLNITGASIGRVAVYSLPEQANVNQHVCIVRCDESRLDPAYLSRLISMPSYQRWILRTQAGATRQALNFDQIREFRFSLPSREAQRRFAEAMARSDQTKAIHGEALRQAEHLFQSLLNLNFGEEN